MYINIVNVCIYRDLTKTCPEFLLDRQFRENLRFDHAKVLVKNFQIDFFGVITKSVPKNTNYLLRHS